MRVKEVLQNCPDAKYIIIKSKATEEMFNITRPRLKEYEGLLNEPIEKFFYHPTTGDVKIVVKELRIDKWKNF